MTVKYRHPKLGEEVSTAAGYYILNQENILEYAGQQILYITGYTCIDASCCGVGNWNFIQVPGYLIKKAPDSEINQQRVSEVEPLKLEEEREAVIRILQEKHPNATIELW